MPEPAADKIRRNLPPMIHGMSNATIWTFTPAVVPGYTSPHMRAFIFILKKRVGVKSAMQSCKRHDALRPK